MAVASLDDYVGVLFGLKISRQAFILRCLQPKDMATVFMLKELKLLADFPKENLDSWLAGAEHGVQFLKRHLTGDRIILYSSLNAVLIHGVLVPLWTLNTLDRDVLCHEFITPDASWVIEHTSGGGRPDRVYLESPLRRLGPQFQDGEKLVFIRSFSGTDEPASVEISQRLVHALDVHFVSERNAWCRLNEDGDLIEVIKVIRENPSDWSKSVTIVTIATEDLARYMCLADMALLYFFDFTRTKPDSFNGWSSIKPINFDTPDLFYHGGVMGAQGSYVNGRMIVEPWVSSDEIVREYMEQRNPTARSYATFKAIDLKTKERIEVSADPAGLSNYFQPDSTLPLEMSPVFFRAEVLQRYKSDPDKYNLDDRSIACRGTWRLRTFDMNEEGQVQTYLRYLGELPYKEQLYWQSFNEWPKGWLSDRAITTDFKGEFYLGYDPLSSLRRIVHDLDNEPPVWWQPRGEALRKSVHYPVTSSQTEWGNELLALDQLVNEGFQIGPLRTIADSLGVKVELDWRAFKLLEECANGKVGDATDAKKLIDPLRQLRDLRNHLKGHASGKKQTLAKEVIRQHGSFKSHFESICDSVGETIKTIRAILPE